MIEQIFFLLIAFQVKHYLADFPLQNSYMLGKFYRKGWVLPLASHCAIHAVFTISIVFFINPALWWLAIVDFVLHFIMDRIKASPDLLGRWQINQPQFWNALGFDQAFHHLTHYGIIWILITY